MSSSYTGTCRSISFDQIRDATNNFDEIKNLGKGGEATVYLADLYIDQKKTQLAVKHLKPNSKEFDNEIKTMPKIQHPNIVSLLGYCNESGQKILVYEYMVKGSLSRYIKKSSTSGISLSWHQRLNICLGAAYGLQYLHSETVECPKGIIHRDVKPDNILLDENWVAKISDFGMLKLSHCGQSKSTFITNLKGTQGYYAPEYLAFNNASRKIDVYAFGVVMFQVLCRKTPWDRGDKSYYRSDDEDLQLWAQQNVDTSIKGEIAQDCLMLFTDIIGRSLQTDPHNRPTMDMVVLDLEKALKCQNLIDEGSHNRENTTTLFHPEPATHRFLHLYVSQSTKVEDNAVVCMKERNEEYAWKEELPAERDPHEWEEWGEWEEHEGDREEEEEPPPSEDPQEWKEREGDREEEEEPPPKVWEKRHVHRKDKDEEPLQEEDPEEWEERQGYRVKEDPYLYRFPISKEGISTKSRLLNYVRRKVIRC